MKPVQIFNIPIVSGEEERARDVESSVLSNLLVVLYACGYFLTGDEKAVTTISPQGNEWDLISNAKFRTARVNSACVN